MIKPNHEQCDQCLECAAMSRCIRAVIAHTRVITFVWAKTQDEAFEEIS